MKMARASCIVVVAFLAAAVVGVSSQDDLETATRAPEDMFVTGGSHAPSRFLALTTNPAKTNEDGSSSQKPASQEDFLKTTTTRSPAPSRPPAVTPNHALTEKKEDSSTRQRQHVKLLKKHTVASEAPSNNSGETTKKKSLKTEKAKLLKEPKSPKTKKDDGASSKSPKAGKKGKKDPAPPTVSPQPSVSPKATKAPKKQPPPVVTPSVLPSTVPSNPPTPDPDRLEHFLADLWLQGYNAREGAPVILGCCPSIANLTSGMFLNDTLDAAAVPFDFVPSAGCTSLVPLPEPNAYFCVSHGGYGADRTQSVDYPLHLHSIQVRPGETNDERLTTALLTDKDEMIEWENGAAVTLDTFVPGDTWNDILRDLGTLTGGDFEPQGLVLSPTNSECAVLADGYSPLLLPFSLPLPLSPGATAPFVRVPDLTPSLELSATSNVVGANDRVFCDPDQLHRGVCAISESTRPPDIGGRPYRVVKGGFGGLAQTAAGGGVGFFKFAEDNEPGVRVYRFELGECTTTTPPTVSAFVGFYELERGSERVADIAPLRGSSNIVAVIETGPLPLDSPTTSTATNAPVSRLCLVDLDQRVGGVLTRKRCVVDYYNVPDPQNVGGPGKVYAQEQIRTGAVSIVDDHCVLSATDANFPYDDGNDDSTVVEMDYGRLIQVCFVDPIFRGDYPLFDDVR